MIRKRTSSFFFFFTISLNIITEFKRGMLKCRQRKELLNPRVKSRRDGKLSLLARKDGTWYEEGSRFNTDRQDQCLEKSESCMDAIRLAFSFVSNTALPGKKKGCHFSIYRSWQAKFLQTCIRLLFCRLSECCL